MQNLTENRLNGTKFKLIQKRKNILTNCHGRMIIRVAIQGETKMGRC